MFIGNITIDFDYFKLFKFYWKHFDINLSFFLYSLGENKFVYSNKLLPLNMKSINLTKKVFTHYWIVCLYSINIRYNVLFLMNFLISFEFSEKTLKLSSDKLSWVDSYSSRFITYATSFILDYFKLFLE